MPGDADTDDGLALARTAHALVESDPRQAGELAGRALAAARADRAPEAEVAALHALGYARHELGDPRAIATLRAAVRVGERNGLAERVALVRRPLAVYLAYAGKIGAALDELDAACAALDGLELARSELFRIAVLGVAGRAPPPPASSEWAVRTLRRHRDAIWEARLLGNRGALGAERGDADAAEPDLARARDLFTALGATPAAQRAAFELARVALVRGDLPLCLARLDAIEATELPALLRSALELLRAQALVAARLMSEARAALHAAQAIWNAAAIEEPEGRLELVRLTLLAGEPATAAELARTAQRSFAARGRPVYGARAAGLRLAAAIASDAVGSAALRSGGRAAATLAAHGWHAEALSVRLSVARAAVAVGSVAAAERELAACASLRRHGPVAGRVELHHVEALVRLARGDRVAAQRSARTGLRLLESHRAALGASELRATASEIGLDLSRLGLRVALSGTDPRSVLAWAESLRASALRSPAVTPPPGRELRARVTDLRRVNAEIQRMQRDGGPPRALVARQAALELSVRRLSRHARGTGTAAALTVAAGPSPAAFLPALVNALGDAALVELIELDGQLTAVTLAGGRLRRHELGPPAPVREQLEWLRFALARLARRDHQGPRRAATLAGALASAQALDRSLVAPLAGALGDRRVVIVPTGSLHGLPWSMLPGLRGRPLVVAPSAAVWLALAGAPAAGRARARVTSIAGPRLRHAAAEATGVGAVYAGATVLTGRQATVPAAMRALDGAAVAHLACHGRFRADSPLFSAIELADGPLNVYELQRLRRAPRLIVLSACELAVSDARPGDELLGFAAALIGLGARTVIASVVPVPDAAAKRLMLALHADLAVGHGPAEALARVQASRRSADAALAGFICLGAG